MTDTANNLNFDKDIVFSGVQPTGNIHLGNYLGAIKNWVDIQSKIKQNLFCIVDLHAITIFKKPEDLRNSTLQTAAYYIACGIDPEKSVIFNQSAVKAHSELCWLFSCITPIGWLNRMTQFKEKSGKNKDKSMLGLYSYPVLMAADILLYHATKVPVGEDQKQHLELARDIAGNFNRLYNTEYFKLPDPLITGDATRVMSLRDGTKKMSKSDESEYSRIHLADSAEEIMQKLKKAKTDALPEISYDVENRPEISNLINIYSALTNKTKQQIIDNYQNVGFAVFKTDLAEILIDKLGPIKKEYDKLINNKDYLITILKQGNEKANIRANKTINEVKDIFGFVNS